MNSKINMDKYKNMDKFAGYKNLDSLVKEAFLPGMGGGSSNTLDMFTGGGGSANPMNALMGGMGGLTGGAAGLAGGAATAVGGNILQGMLTQDSALVQMAEMYAFEKGGQALYNKVKSNPSELLKVAEGAVEAGATNPAAVANKPALKKLTDYVASKGTSLMDLAKKIPGSKFFTNAAATIGEKGIGSAIKGVGQNALLKTVGTKAAPTILGKGLGLATKALTGPIGWGLLGVEAVNWLLGNDSKQWMSKAVDLLSDKGQINPKEKSTFLSTLMDIFTKGVEAQLAEEQAQQQVAAYYKNREKQALLFNNIHRSKEASFSILKLQQEEKDILENIEIIKQALAMTDIPMVGNILRQVTDLVSSPDVQELVNRSVEEAEGIPKDKKQQVVQQMMDTINRGIQEYQSQLEETKKQQNPQQTNAPANNAAQNTGNPTAPNTNTTTQPPVDNSVVNNQGTAFNPTSNPNIVTDINGNQFKFDPTTKTTTAI